MHREISVYPCTECGAYREDNEDVEKYNLNLTKLKNVININPKDKYDDNLAPVDFFAICDGHGGRDVAKYVVPELETRFMNVKLNYPLPKRLIENIFTSVQNKLKKHPRKIADGCGCTALVVIRYLDNYNRAADNIQVVNLGDCRAVLSRNGLAIPLTIDHKPYWSDEKRRINAVNHQYNTHEKVHYDAGDWRIGDLSVSRSFGDLDNTPYVTHTPDSFTYALQKEDEFIIMACDGVWDVLQNHDAVNLVRDFLTNNNIELYSIPRKFNAHEEKRLASKNGHINVAQILMKYAYAKGSTDNISIYIIKLK